MSSELTNMVAEWAAELTYEAVPVDVRRRLKDCLADFVACGVGGSAFSSEFVHRAATRWSMAGGAPVFGESARVSEERAAFLNSVCASSLDFDDTLHGHPGSVMFPVVLALGEPDNVPGDRLMTAAAVGYEIAARLVANFHPIVPRYEAVWDVGTLQALAATVAGSVLLGLEVKGIETAMGIVSGSAPVPLPRKFDGNEGRGMMKSARAFAASSAVTAVQLAADGFTAPKSTLDGNLGFWHRDGEMLQENRDPDLQLGSRWMTLETEFKPFMACRFLHPALEALQRVIADSGLTLSDVREIHVSSFSLIADAYHNSLEPSTDLDAQFSLPITMAALMHAGTLTADTYRIGRWDSDQRRLAERVRVTVDEKFDEAFPNRLGARVEVLGHRDSLGVASVNDALGSPRRPLSPITLQHKWRALIDGVRGEEDADTLLGTCDEFDLQRTQDISALMALPTAAEVRFAPE